MRTRYLTTCAGGAGVGDVGVSGRAHGMGVWAGRVCSRERRCARKSTRVPEMPAAGRGACASEGEG